MATQHPERVTGVILAGGLGRRMRALAGRAEVRGRSDADAPPADMGGEGGVDKGLLMFRGRAMVEHVIARLDPQVDAILINANRNLARYRTFGRPVVTDAISGFAGPLAGLHAAFALARTDWLVTVPCDSPFLPADLVARLLGAARAAGALIAVARAAGREQPVFALVHRGLHDNLAHFLAAGGRKIDAWYGPLDPATAFFDDERAFRNINTPAELARYEHED